MAVILVISDESATIDCFLEHINDQHFVLTAPKQKDAATALIYNAIDIVFVESRLAYASNNALLDDLQKHANKAAVIFLISKLEREQTDQYICDGAFDVIEKPLQRLELRRFVNKVADRQEMARELDKMRNDIDDQPFADRFKNNPMFPGAYGERINNVIYDQNSLNYKEVFHAFSRSISNIADTDKLCFAITEALAAIFKVNSASLLIIDSLNGENVVRGHMGIDNKLIKRAAFPMFKGLTLWLSKHRKILRLSNPIYERAIVDSDVRRDMAILNAGICAPLSMHGALIGAIALGDKMIGNGFSVEELDLLPALAVYLSAVIQNTVNYSAYMSKSIYHDNIINNINSGIIVIDKAGKITTCNIKAANMLGLNAADVIGKDVQKAGSKIADVMLRALMDEKECRDREITDNATKATFGVRASQLKDGFNNIAGVVITLQDLTKSKKMETQLKYFEDKAFWINLASCMSTKMRDSLVTVNTFAQLFPEKHNDHEFKTEYYKVLISELKRLEEVTDKLTLFSRQTQPRPQNIKIIALIDSLLCEHADKFKKNKIAITKQYKCRDQQVYIDPDQIILAISNIINNAADAMPDGGGLTLTLKATNTGPATDPEFIDLLIKDTGVGVSTTVWPHIFTPFYSTKQSSLGLGLPVAKRIIESNNGALSITSKDREGCAINILLPVNAPNSTLPQVENNFVNSFESGN